LGLTSLSEYVCVDAAKIDREILGFEAFYPLTDVAIIQIDYAVSVDCD